MYIFKGIQNKKIRKGPQNTGGPQNARFDILSWDIGYQF